jgi:hypothetical protein
MGHVINLVVQAMLHAINEAEDPDVNDYFELHKSEPIHLDDESAEKLYGIVDEEMKDSELPEGVEDDDDDDDGDWSDKELHDLIEVVADKRAADAEARRQSASAIKKVCIVCVWDCLLS